MQLEDLLSRLPAERRVLSDGDTHLKAGDILAAANQYRASLIGGKETRFTLSCPDTISNLIWMVALDGRAESVFLCPESVRNSTAYQQLLERSGSRDEILGRPDNLQTTADPKTRPEIASTDPRTTWLVATSGTTGTPKLVPHTTTGLIRTIKKDINKGLLYRWGLVYDPFRFAGLQVALQALASGSNLLVCDKQDFNTQISMLREFDVNALSATPTFWRKVLMHGGLSGHHFKQITLGGEIADKEILAKLRKCFPQARITHIYASTEAGVGFAVTDGVSGFPYNYLPQTPDGTSLRISNEGHLHILPAIARGKPKEEDQPRLETSDDYIDTGDIVTVEGNRVYFLGRSSGTINVGGNKVSPEEVEAVIRSAPGVADALVSAKRSSITGELVIARVVAMPGENDLKSLKRQIQDVCRRSLERHKIPAIIQFTPELPYNAAGKLIRGKQ